MSVINRTESKETTVSIDLPVSARETDELISTLVLGNKVIPELVTPDEISDPSVYKRFMGLEQKTRFREALLDTLFHSWEAEHGEDQANEMLASFQHFTQTLDENGAAIFGAINSTADFEKLITEYTRILEESGSYSWIHTFVNLANHPSFLTNQEFNAAFMHPLFITLISYRVGGPIRIVDSRGKDAEPIKILAQDNMLHIDNTPFNDEFKIILTWERGRPSGPKGQNFVFLPGTHKGSRQCQVGPEGPYSSENGSIFITPESIDKVFALQERSLGKRAVVELTHDTKPLTTIFQAGALVHHRYRTAENLARSCMILAFHRAEDNPGQLVAPEHLEATAAKTNNLYQLLLGQHGNGSQDAFLAAIATESAQIGTILHRLEDREDGAVEILPSSRELSEEDMVQWKIAATDAPTVTDKKLAAHFIPLGQTLSEEDYFQLVVDMMIFDKHGPLDLILYADAHEEIRKWARNQIREKNLEQLRAQIDSDWRPHLQDPSTATLLSPAALKAITVQLAQAATDRLEAGVTEAHLNSAEKISPVDAYRSVRQLLLDLGESIVRCEDQAAFLSTSLFIFWSCDSLIKLDSEAFAGLVPTGARLLANYTSTAVLLEKSIQPAEDATNEEARRPSYEPEVLFS